VTLSVLALLGATPAYAQSVMVLRVEPAAEPLCTALEAALGSYTILPDPGFHAEAQRRGMDPGSDPALDALTPLLDVDLILVPRQANATTLWLDYRVGRTGQPAGQIEVPLSQGGLTERGARVVVQQTEARLGQLDGDSVSARAGTDDMIDSEQDDASEDDDGDDGGDARLSLDLALGAGVGSRAVDWPAVIEVRSVDVGAFPVVEVIAEPRIALSDAVTFGARLAYATSVGAEVDEPHIAGTPDTVGIRAHRFDFGVGPELGFGGGDVQLGLQAGYAVTNVRPDVHHLQTPAYSLAGPRLRLALRIALGETLSVGLSPHGQLIMVVGEQLQDVGAEGSGIGFGGEATIGIALSKILTMQLGYHESHASVGSMLGGSVSDVERTGTARLMGTL
jgi:hypothetical protein